MAVTQSIQNKASVNFGSVVDDDGYAFHWEGGVKVFTGDGTPNGIITAPLGSRYYHIGTSPLMFINIDGVTTWTKSGSL